MSGLRARLDRIPLDIWHLADDAAVQAGGSTNIFIAWLRLFDSDGGRAERYRLLLDADLFNPMGQVLGKIAEFLHMFFMVIAGYAVWAIEAVVNPDRLLRGLSSAYQSLTSRLFEVFPPQALVAATFAILVLRIFIQQAPGDVTIGSAKTSARLTKTHWQRLASGFAVMSIVLILVANPFRLAQEALKAVAVFSGFLTGNDAETLHRLMVSGNVNQILRPITQMITYHDVLSPECSATWSQVINSGNTSVLSTCLTQAQVNAASSPGVITLTLSILALAIAACFGYFAFIVLKQLLIHISLMVYHLVILAWVGALSLAHRRAYDKLAREVGMAGRHFVITMAIVLVISVIPVWFLQFVGEIPGLPLWLEFILIAIGYVVTGQVVAVMTRALDDGKSWKENWKEAFTKEDTLSETISKKMSDSTIQKTLYPADDQKKAVANPFADQTKAGKEWVGGKWQSTKGAVRFGGKGAAGQENSDSPELDAAAQKVVLAAPAASSPAPAPAPTPADPTQARAPDPSESSAPSAAPVAADEPTFSNVPFSAEERQAHDILTQVVSAFPYIRMAYYVATGSDGETTVMKSPSVDESDTSAVFRPSVDIRTDSAVYTMDRGGTAVVGTPLADIQVPGNTQTTVSGDTLTSPQAEPGGMTDLVRGYLDNVVRRIYETAPESGRDIIARPDGVLDLSGSSFGLALPAYHDSGVPKTVWDKLRIPDPMTIESDIISISGGVAEADRLRNVEEALGDPSFESPNSIAGLALTAGRDRGGNTVIREATRGGFGDDV